MPRPWLNPSRIGEESAGRGSKAFREQRQPEAEAQLEDFQEKRERAAKRAPEGIPVGSRQRNPKAFRKEKRERAASRAPKGTCAGSRQPKARESSTNLSDIPGPLAPI
jgi:hypothetical protein